MEVYRPRNVSSTWSDFRRFSSFNSTESVVVMIYVNRNEWRFLIISSHILRCPLAPRASTLLWVWSGVKLLWWYVINVIPDSWDFIIKFETNSRPWMMCSIIWNTALAACVIHSYIFGIHHISPKVSWFILFKCVNWDLLSFYYYKSYTIWGWDPSVIGKEKEERTSKARVPFQSSWAWGQRLRNVRVNQKILKKAGHGSPSVIHPDFWNIEPEGEPLFTNSSRFQDSILVFCFFVTSHTL